MYVYTNITTIANNYNNSASCKQNQQTKHVNPFPKSVPDASSQILKNDFFGTNNYQALM